MALHAHNDDASINDGQATTGTATLMEIFRLNKIHKWTALVRDYGNLRRDGHPLIWEGFLGFLNIYIYIYPRGIVSCSTVVFTLLLTIVALK